MFYQIQLYRCQIIQLANKPYSTRWSNLQSSSNRILKKAATAANLAAKRSTVSVSRLELNAQMLAGARAASMEAVRRSTTETTGTIYLGCQLKKLY